MRQGFTMVEMLVAMGLGTLVLAAVLSLFVTSNQSYVAQEKLVTAEQNVRASLEIMSHELRMAGYVPAGNVDNGALSNGRIISAAASSIQFLADIDADDRSDAVAGLADMAERIQYTLNGTTLMRTSWTWNGNTFVDPSNTGAVTVAPNITNLVMTYYDEDDDIITLPIAAGDFDDIRSVSITMTGQTSSDVYGAPRTRTLTSSFQMRNMGLDTTKW